MNCESAAGASTLHQNHMKIDDTDIIVTSYSDRHFVVITQLNKFGTLVS